MMVIWRDWELVLAFHHLGISVTVYVPRGGCVEGGTGKNEVGVGV